ncbi:MAG: hypothetical protein K6E10_07260 [Eubacterium sp.]|nr:hypothetical protein [Eubacterium sp.]
MKKFFSFVIAILVAISVSMANIGSLNAASYPTFVPQEENKIVYKDAENANETILITYNINPVYDYERILVGLYDPSGNPVANNGNTGRIFYNTVKKARTYSLRWDITNKATGKYIIKARMQYSSDNETWYDVPGESVNYVTIEASGKGQYSNEWVNGKWYGSDGVQTYNGILSWKSNYKGWWVEDSTGWYPTDAWYKIDGNWYYFEPDGYMASSEWYNGYYFSSSGAWVYTATGSWKYSSDGWWYGDTTGWYAQNQWAKIDGAWYYFDGNGYMVTDQYVDGYWLGANGVCY